MGGKEEKRVVGGRKKEAPYGASFIMLSNINPEAGQALDH
jgi:hypothetical protein